MSDPQMATLLEYVSHGGARPRGAMPSELQWLGEATEVQFDQFLQALLDAELGVESDPALSDVFRHLMYRLRPWDPTNRRRLPTATI